MPTLSRRTFLSASSCALASAGLSRTTFALPIRARHPVASFVPQFFSVDTLRALASSGIDAAHSAGATYADIRISDLHTLDVAQGGPPRPGCTLALEFGYGIRVQVDGAWAFAFGTHLDADSIAHSARSAVQTARGLAKVAPRRKELVPAPVTTGEWETPMQIDPFSVSPDEHANVIGGLMDVGTRLPHASLAPCRITWSAETRVFASTEGSRVTQRFFRVVPLIAADYPQDGPRGMTTISIPGVVPTTGGLENIVGAALQERIKATVEDAARWSRFPTTTAQLSRVPAVFDGTMLGCMASETLIPALDLGRALGHEADGAGTSFLAPVNDVLGKPLFSPLLNVSVDRALPNYGAARWDDEGVATEAFPVIQRGHVVDYLGTRVTTPALADWYAKSRAPLKSHGAAVSWRPSLAPMGWASSVMINANANGASLDELVKQLSNGIVVRGGARCAVASDAQLSGGMSFPTMIYEVKKGQITRRIMDGSLQFSTPKFWSNISALGGEHSLEVHVRSEPLRPSFIPTTMPITAPAAIVQNVDVVPPYRRRS